MSIYLQALAADQAGDWDLAHSLIQELSSSSAAWIHAYLHRKEGDRFNAQYWYHKAGKPYHEGSLEQEWEEIYQYLTEVKKS